MGGGFLFTDDVPEPPSDYNFWPWQFPDPSLSPSSPSSLSPSPLFQSPDDRPKFHNSSKQNQPAPPKTFPHPPVSSNPPNFPNFPPIPPYFPNPASFINPSAFANPAFSNFFPPTYFTNPPPFGNKPTYSKTGPFSKVSQPTSKDNNPFTKSSFPKGPENGSKEGKKDSRSPPVTPASPSSVDNLPSSSIPLSNDSNFSFQNDSNVLNIPVQTNEQNDKENDKENDTEKDEETSGKLTPDLAVTKIQAFYRGYQVRQSEPLKYLRILSKGKADMEDLKKKLSDSVELAKLRNDLKERKKMSEALMGVLLRLDTVQCPNGVVRDIRKSLTRQVIALMDSVDSLSQEETMMDSVDSLSQEEMIKGGVEDKDNGHPCVREGSGNCECDSQNLEKTNTYEVAGCQCVETSVERRQEGKREEQGGGGEEKQGGGEEKQGGGEEKQGGGEEKQGGGEEKQGGGEEKQGGGEEKQGGGEENQGGGEENQGGGEENQGGGEEKQEGGEEKQEVGEEKQEPLEVKVEEIKKNVEGFEKEVIVDEVSTCEEKDNDLQAGVPVQSKIDDRCAGSSLVESEDVREGPDEMEGKKNAEKIPDRKEEGEITEVSEEKKIDSVVLASLLSEEGSAELIGQLLENLMKQNRLLKAELRKGEKLREEQAKIAAQQVETMAALSNKVDMLTKALLPNDKDRESSQPVVSPICFSQGHPSNKIANPVFVLPAMGVGGGVRNLETGRKRDTRNRDIRPCPSSTSHVVPGKMKRKIPNPYPHFAFV